MELDRIKSEAVLAEFIGTFGLTFAVLVGLTTASLGLETGLVAAATLGIMVLAIGPISGCHINPAITIGQYSIGKIDFINSVSYIIAQLSGALLALVVLSLFNSGEIFELASFNTWEVFWAELLGAFIFGFAVAGAVYNELKPAAAALAVGGGLFLGILFASIASNGILNPAVAIGVGSSGWAYVLGPVVGSIFGMGAYRLLLPPKKSKKSK